MPQAADRADSRPGPALADLLRGVRALVFDMDGLLLNTERLARNGLRLAATELGLEADEALFAAMIGVPADGCRLLLFDRYGDAVSPDAFFAASERQLHAQIDAGEMRLQPGAQALLDALRQAGVSRALATSSAREKAMHQLRRAGVADCFDAIVTRDDVARGKPYPDLFLQAAQRLQTAPKHCLALEDSYNGVRAAHAAGMPVLMVPDLLGATAEMHDKSLAVASDLHEVLRLLADKLAPAADRAPRRDGFR
jgi:HAD superfamily hydrolase (TIGR01509 family)